jgi:hypothetical protein
MVHSPWIPITTHSHSWVILETDSIITLCRPNCTGWICTFIENSWPSKHLSFLISGVYPWEVVPSCLNVTTFMFSHFHISMLQIFFHHLAVVC